MENDQDIDDIISALWWVGCLDERYVDKMDAAEDKAREALERIYIRLLPKNMKECRKA